MHGVKNYLGVAVVLGGVAAGMGAPPPDSIHPLSLARVAAAFAQLRVPVLVGLRVGQQVGQQVGLQVGRCVLKRMMRVGGIGITVSLSLRLINFDMG